MTLTACSGRVGVVASPSVYSINPPYDPDAEYSEHHSGFIKNSNNGYRAIKDLFRLLGFNRDKQGVHDWNPLRDLVRQGSSVVIVANMVDIDYSGNGAMITHPSIIRAVLDYVALAVGPTGRITVGITTTLPVDGHALTKHLELDTIAHAVETRFGTAVVIEDFREFWNKPISRMPYLRQWCVRARPERASTQWIEIDLGSTSEYAALGARCRNLHVPGEDRNRNFNGQRFVYRISDTLLNADLVVNLAKMKTHSTAGVTLCTKNWIGAMGNRRGLPHYSSGSPSSGGDCYPNTALFRHRLAAEALGFVADRDFLSNVNKTLIAPLRDFINRNSNNVVAGSPLLNGKWYENDTLWRGVLDMHRIVLHVCRDGTIATKPQRKVLGIVDGIVAGDGDGPFKVKPVKAGILLGGTDPLLVDVVATRIMGFDERKIKHLAKGVERFLGGEAATKDIDCVSNEERWKPAGRADFHDHLCFEAPSCFRGKIER